MNKFEEFHDNNYGLTLINVSLIKTVCVVEDITIITMVDNEVYHVKESYIEVFERLQ